MTEREAFCKSEFLNETAVSHIWKIWIQEIHIWVSRVSQVVDP